METEKTPRTPQAGDKYIVRLPDGMREQIAERARRNNRSMNAEIVSMLQHVMEQGAGAPGLDVDALVDALAPKLAAHLKAKL